MKNEQPSKLKSLHREELKKITKETEKTPSNDRHPIDVPDEVLLGVSNKMLKIGNFTTC